MHGDEAVHAEKFHTLWKQGTYQYDPNEFHGPTIYYLTLPVPALRGQHDFAHTDETTYRIVPALCGVGLLLLLLLTVDGLGRAATLWAAVFTAISPAMVFYSRYYIQEIPLVFFSFGLIAALWRFNRSGRAGWCWLAGAFLGLMMATKETWIIAVLAMLLALLLARLVNLLRDRTEAPQRPMPRRLLIGSMALSIALAALFLSGHGTNARGPLDAVTTYATYLQRGGGGETEHVHRWNYYLSSLAWTNNFKSTQPWARRLQNRQLLGQTIQPPFLWSEGFIMALALLGLLVILPRKDSGDERAEAEHDAAGLLRFLAFYTVLMTLIYALIPYKTPWNSLGFWHGMILLAGVGAAALLRSLRVWPLQAPVFVLLLLGCAHLGKQAYAASFQFPADRRNPYVYAHPGTDVVRLGTRVEELARLHPQGMKMIFNVITPPGFNAWPLPWYLRRLPNAAYFRQTPVPADAPLLIVPSEAEEAVKQQLKGKYQVEYHGLRPGVLVALFIEESLWQAYLKERAKATGPAP